jgi:hypothetical protein
VSLLHASTAATGLATEISEISATFCTGIEIQRWRKLIGEIVFAALIRLQTRLFQPSQARDPKKYRLP